MFAWAVATLRDKYREIGHLNGECNQRTSRITATVHRELPKRAVKLAINTPKSVFLAHFRRVLRVRMRFLARRAGADNAPGNWGVYRVWSVHYLPGREPVIRMSTSLRALCCQSGPDVT